MHAVIAEEVLQHRKRLGMMSGPPTPRNASAEPNVPLFTRLLSLSSQKKIIIANGHNIHIEDDDINENDTPRMDRLDSGRTTSSMSESSYMIGDNDSTFDVCETIDDLMLGLHTCTEAETNLLQVNRNIIHIQKDITFTHDWLLDGSDTSEGEGDIDELLLSPKSRRRRKFGDPALDQMLGMLEIENASYCTTPGSSVIEGDINNSSSKDDTEKNEEEVIEFAADFSQFDSSADNDNDGDDIFGAFADCSNSNSYIQAESSENRLPISGENNLQNDIVYEYENNETCDEVNNEQSLNEEMPNTIEVPKVNGNDDNIAQGGKEDIISSPGYTPPESIACLVSDLDAELDVTIDQCFNSSSDKSIESENSLSHDGDNCTNNLLHVLNDESDSLIQQQQQQQMNDEYKQPLLMSSILLESLPIPMPSSTSEDHIASLTRRIQMHHMASKDEKDKKRDNSTIQAEDEVLERKLFDTIHSGYYESITGDDSDNDYFDSIVMEEILAIPWPFHEIDLKESILNEDSDPDSDGLLYPVDSNETESDESESIDHLNFDVYISNRLSQLDFASDEIMSCILHRVSQKEEAINSGVENVFAAELDVSTALLFAKRSRECLHHAKNGYPLSGTTGKHNVISAGLDILHIADSKDRLCYLADTIDQISSICDEEAQWWKDVSAKMIAPHRFEKLVDDTRRLRDMIRGEEVLSHVTSLSSMKDRLNHLPEALLRRIEVSLAGLFSRILNTGESSPVAFDEHFLEFETLLHSWLSCIQLKEETDHTETQQSLSNIIGAEWSSCILTILSLEADKAIAGAVLDSYHATRMKTQLNSDHGTTLEEVQVQLSGLSFDQNDEETLQSVSHRLLVMHLGCGHDSSALSSTLFHLCSRLVELMNLYEVSLQWLQTIIHKMDAENKPITDGSVAADQSKCRDSPELNNTTVSSMSSNEPSTSSASVDDGPQAQDERPVPQDLMFKTDSTMTPLDDMYKAMHKSMILIRRGLWKKCEASMIHLIEFYISQSGGLGAQSGDGKDLATANLRLTYDVLLQFTSFTSHFLDEDEEGDDQCCALESELSKLYESHLRYVHIEAMKTMGTLLSHESWQLTPLEVANVEATNGNSNNSKDDAIIIRGIYEAVRDLLLGSTHTKSKPEHQFVITSRAENHGYRYCTSFERFVDNVPPSDPSTPKHNSSVHRQLNNCSGISSKEFVSKILPLVEMKPCGGQTISILTQSSANGLVKWTARLLAVGNALPLVADDASAAVMTLFDLYILTAFRFCAGSKPNEDALIGFGRGTASSSSSATSVSVTMEADAVAPLPREEKDFVQTQEFIRSSRKRLEHMVNLDKFQSTCDDMSPTSPRSKNAVTNAFAQRLEKEASAACSCFFAAILVDVVSNICNPAGQTQTSEQDALWTDLKDMTSTLIENNGDMNGLEHDESLVTYAKAAVLTMPNLVTQATGYATVNSISGKQLIFQIMCCGKVWESHTMQEEPNAYVEDLCELCALLWGYMSSSMTLPPCLLEYTWNQLVKSAFMLLLEGFSKVTNCSTEGRSLMSMDLATLSHGLSSRSVLAEVEDDYPKAGEPPKTCREEMKGYVDAFIKVFYFPNDDIINWVKENAGDYHIDHCQSLIQSKATGNKDKKFLTDGKQAVLDIYAKLKK